MGLISIQILSNKKQKKSKLRQSTNGYKLIIISSLSVKQTTSLLQRSLSDFCNGSYF